MTAVDEDQACLDSLPALDTAPPAPSLCIEPLTTVLDRVRNKPPRQYLIRRILAEGAYGIFGAEDKAGKSWAIYDLAVSVGSGTPWMNTWDIDLPGPVVMFLGEGGEDKAVRRLEAVARDRGVPLDDIAARIHLCSSAPNLTSGQHLDQIRQYVEQVQPVLVIVDPLYLAAAGADGRDLYAMGAVLAGIQRVCEPRGVALLITHHWNKGGVGGGQQRFTGVGPSAWGRTNISASVEQHDTDPATAKTTATLRLQFQGDETAEPDTVITREVWADDPNDLNTPLHYTVRKANTAGVEDYRRLKVLQTVQDNYGIGVEALRRQVGGRTQDTSALINAMVQAGQIESFPDGRRKGYRIPGTSPFPGTGTNGTTA